jgi:D-3-phosphoglycerate dehydrogenase / 2-oxoglutarate reductase
MAVSQVAREPATFVAPAEDDTEARGRARILVAEPLAPEGLQLLQAIHDVDVRTEMSRSEFLEALPDYEALIVRSQVQVDAEAIAAGSRLVVIGRAGVGVDNVDLDAATRAGITVINAPTANTIAAAEHTLALLYAVARRVAAADASVRRGEWKRSEFTGVELRGKTLGIVGLGKIGMAIAERARAMEMQILAHDPYVSTEVAANHGATLVEFAALLRASDVVSVHVPLTRSTKNLIGARELRAMPKGAILLNVARGGVVDEQALAEALRSGHIGGAGVDVFADEPPRDSPLLDAPNTVLTPHLGASTAEAQVRVAVEAAQQVLDVLEGRPARYAVNAPLLTPETAQTLAPFLPLAQMLGQFYAQFAPDMEGLTLEVAGEIAAHDTAPLSAAVLRGLLETVTEERVNLVNAAHIARSRGIALVERRTPEAGRHGSLVTLSGKASVGGTIAAGEPRLVRLGNYALDMPPARYMLVTRHSDKPGTMGRVGLMLGQADVNISAMHLARSGARQDAFMILALDDPVPDRVADEIRADEAVLDLWLIRLGAG